MVSHSNEYRVPGEGEAVDIKETMRTTQGSTRDARRTLTAAAGRV